MGTWSKTKDRRPDRARGKKAKKHHEPPSRVDLLEFKLQVTEYDRTQIAPIYTGDHIHKEPQTPESLPNLTLTKRRAT